MGFKNHLVVYSDYAPKDASGNPINAYGPTVVIPGGSGGSLQIAVPNESRVTRLSVVQTAGTAVGATVELLYSSLPFPGPYAGAAPKPVVTFSLPYTYPTGVQVSLYRVLSSQTVLSGQALEIYYDQGHAYSNADGTQSQAQRWLYLAILPTGAGGSTSWDFSLTTVMENAGR